LYSNVKRRRFAFANTSTSKPTFERLNCALSILNYLHRPSSLN